MVIIQLFKFRKESEEWFEIREGVLQKWKIGKERGKVRKSEEKKEKKEK